MRIEQGDYCVPLVMRIETNTAGTAAKFTKLKICEIYFNRVPHSAFLTPNTELVCILYVISYITTVLLCNYVKLYKKKSPLCDV